MYIPFDELPDHSRLWIYQSDRAFIQEEIKQISDRLLAFCHQWNAHQQALNSSFVIAYDRFIILAVDEGVHAASGCSIDSSVAVIREIGQTFGVDLFNRLDQALLVDGSVELKPLSVVKKELSEGDIPEGAKVFNNLVKDKAEFESAWVVPLEDSWLSRFVPVS